MIKITNYIFIQLLIVIITTNCIFAQSYQFSTENKKAIKYYNTAVTYYKSGNFEETISFLNKSIKSDSRFIEAWLLLGDSYSEVNSRKLAISSYESAIKIDSSFFPATYYFLANLNYEIGNYQQSVDYYMYFSRIPSVSNEMLVLAYKRLLFASTAANLVKNPDSINLINIGHSVNTYGDEYINYMNADKDYMMLTRRTKLTESQQQNPVYREELLYTTKTDSSWAEPAPVELKWRDDLNMGSLNLSTDGRSMYFTGCYWPQGQGGCDLYVSQKVGDIWNKPENLGNNINTMSWESQPIISSDSKKLFFASKRKGGKGGSDIWMSILLKDGRWSPPINLGDSINSPKDEMAPFLHADGNTLFFASTGHPGLGGYDLFISRQDELGRWSLAKNIGYPANSKHNDINIITSIDGKQSLISSDRAGGKGNMDIYAFDNYQEIIPKKIMYIEGIIVDEITRKPLNAKVQITNISTSEKINTTFSDPITGGFLLIVFPGVEYAFNISKDGYLFLSENINLKDTTGITSVKQLFELSPIAKGNHLVMNNVFFEFNEYRLLSPSFIELNKLAEILIQNPDFNIEIIGHTDSIGDPAYNMQLSLNRAKSVRDYLTNAGVNTNRLNTVGMGITKPVASNNTEQGRMRNRRTEILIK